MAKGLCLTHYKRHRAGKPLVYDGPQVGERSGYGLYGILTRDEHAVLPRDPTTRTEHRTRRKPRWGLPPVWLTDF